MSDSYVTGDLSQLNALLEELKTDYYVDVGIIGNPSSGSPELSLAEIGAVHEFGDPAHNIPQRSFIRMPLEVKQGDIAAKVEQRAQGHVAEGNVKAVFEDIGVAADAAIQEAFESGGFGSWEPLKPATVDRKGSSAILIDEGFLRRGITHRVGKGGSNGAAD